MMTLPKTVISLHDVDVVLGNVRLNAVTLDVPEHSRFALLGLPHSGKTTIVEMFAGLVTVSAGIGRVLDHVLQSPHIADDRAIGFLHQSINWPGNLTLQEFIRSAVDQQHDRLRLPIDEHIALSGLRGREFVVGDQLLPKERQLARLIALHAQNPDVLILDDPTGGLRPEERHVVLDVIEHISTRRTVFFTTLYLTDVQRLATHAALLYQGTILAQGTTASVFALPDTVVFRVGLLGPTRIVYEYLRDLAWVQQVVERQEGELTVWTIWLHQDADAPTNLLRAILADRGLKVIQFNLIRRPVDGFLAELEQATGEHA